MEGRERLFRTLVAASIFSLAAHAAILSLYVEPTYTLTVALLLALGVAGSTNLPTSILPWRTTRAKSDSPVSAGVS